MRASAMIGLIAALLLGLFTDPLAAMQVVRIAQNVQWSEVSFDRGNFGQLTVIAARKQSEDSLQAHLMLIEKATVLKADQRSKLELAGQIDIHRFFSEYENLKRSMKFGTLSRNEWQEQFAAIQQSIQPFKDRYASGLHDESSLLAKTTAALLDAEQQASVQQLFNERETSIYINNVRITLAMIDRRVPLTQTQRSTMTELLLSKTQPPKDYGSSRMPYFTVLNQMTQVEDELRELFSEQEWDAISRLILAGKTAVNK